MRKYYIKDIKKGKSILIIIDNEFDNFQLNEDDFIIFKDIKGISQLLDGKKRKIKNCEDNKFEIDEDSSNYEDYIRGGVVEEITEKITINDKKFEEILELPVQWEYVNIRDIELNLHLGFLSLHEYYKKTKKLPENNEDDLSKIMNITKDIYKRNQNNWLKDIKLKEDLLGDVYKFSNCQISPLCGYGGGVVSQEIIKYIGIYKPINQWFRVQFFDILDKEVNHDAKSKGTRYNDQLLIFGKETQKKIESLNVFMIGAGAVGCEILKYCAMMGISTGPNSLLTVTDHDRIEKSNLCRQFLFRENNIGNLKSECAINAVKLMNNKINCVAMQEFVYEKTDKIFDKAFFEKQNAVIIAVDNFEARIYISEQCEKYNIPYFNCGTDGPYANVEAFIPGKIVQSSYPTNYKRVVPPCTLKMFPSSINHCVIWALNHFEKFFNKNIINIKNMNNDINKFYKDMNKIIDLRIQFYQIKKLFKFLKIANSKNFDKCIKYSIKISQVFY